MWRLTLVALAPNSQPGARSRGAQAERVAAGSTCYIPEKSWVDYGVLTSATQERPLEPRYRRILSFGDVLDESIGLFRRHWLVFALVSAVCLLPPGLFTVLLALSGTLDSSNFARQLQFGETPTPAALTRLVGPFLLLYVVTAVFYLAWTTAIIVTTDEYLHAAEPTAGVIFSRTMRRYLPALLTGLVCVLALVVVMIPAALLLVLYAYAFPFSLLAIVVAIVGIVVWWVRPTWRSVWLKWLIVLATPFGLVAYFLGTWSMYLCAAVLEQHGPIPAIRRSMQLVDRHWFRVVAILLVASTIVSTLQYFPTMLVQFPLMISNAVRGEIGLGPTQLAISTAVGIVAQVLFASMATIVYALVFIDLRNRREGTDIAERVSQLEAANG